MPMTPTASGWPTSARPISKACVPSTRHSEGWCPFAPGATGNVATEDIVYMFERMGMATGIDLDALVAVARDGAALPGSLAGGRVRVAVTARAEVAIIKGLVVVRLGRPDRSHLGIHTATSSNPNKPPATDRRKYQVARRLRCRRSDRYSKDCGIQAVPVQSLFAAKPRISGTRSGC